MEFQWDILIGEYKKNQLGLVKMLSRKYEKIIYCHSFQMFSVHSVISLQEKVSKSSVCRNYNNCTIFTLFLHLNNLR